MSNAKKKQEAQPVTPRLLEKYEIMVADGRILADDAQREVLSRLQGVFDALTIAQAPKGKSKLKALLGRKEKLPTARGLYVWGNVGRGKSMLMDLFFDHVVVARKRRVHFHAFMQEVHARLHLLRHTYAVRRAGGDPTAMIVRELAEQVELLCFDELQATDVVDASLIFRLFDGLIAAGVMIVTTSNHPPASIYTGFVQRERFQKIIALIEERMDVLSLSSPQDYRLRQVQSLQRVFCWPLGMQADDFIKQTLARLAPDAHPEPVVLSVQGRQVRMAAYQDDIGRASFRELCEAPLGPADYLAIARRFDTFVLTGVPKLRPEQRNEAKRFVTLVDALYEHKVNLIMTLNADPRSLYESGDGAFEFQRTASRLAEMQSENYLKQKRMDRDS